jgi:glycosyltransferase involved in cell wall biosynthesis
MMKHAVWVNITTLMNWARPAVGVVRVEQEYVRWLIQNPMQQTVVRFIIFDPRIKQFLQVPTDRVAARLAQDFARDESALPSAEERLKAFAKRYANYVPPTLIPRARAVALALIRFARRAKTQIQAMRSRPQSQSQGAFPLGDQWCPSAFSPAVFGQGDHFVSMGLDWDQLDMEALYTLKQTHVLRVTLMCYDTIPALFPHLVVASPAGFSAYLIELAWCADQVLCISENTRKDFCAFMRRMGGPLPQTEVIRLGDSFVDTQTIDSKPRSPKVARVANRAFVLYVSTIERRKNHELLYRVWIRLKERGVATPKLIFVGMPGWGVNDFLADLSLDRRIAGDIEILNHVTDHDLHWLYRQSLFTVYPSLYEGWGLPVTESLAHGKFCLCSSAASIPEAGGEFCEYLDPWDLPAWVDRIAGLLCEPGHIAGLDARISQGFRPTAWASTAAQIHGFVNSTGIHCRY